MVTAYDFEDDDQSNDLGSIGKKLLQASKSKDSLIKLLKVQGTPIWHVGPDMCAYKLNLCLVCTAASRGAT